MSGKIVYLLAVVVLATVVSVTNGTPAAAPLESYASKANLSNHLVVGSRVPGDRLVLRQSVTKSSAWLQIVTITQTFNTSGYDKITQVAAFDQKTNGNGATPSLMSGGPGTNAVALHFKSKRGHGINFIVEVYARAY